MAKMSNNMLEGVATGVEDTEIDHKNSDEDIVKKVGILIEEALQIHSIKAKDWAEAMRFFDGDIWSSPEDKNEYNSEVHINRVFPTVRNLVGFMSDSRPQPEVVPPPLLSAPRDADDQTKEIYRIRRDLNMRKSKLTEIACKNTWDRVDMPFKLQTGLYHMVLKADVFFCPGWSTKLNDIVISMKKPEEVLIDPTILHNGDWDSARYIVYRVNKNRQWIRDNYPEMEDKIQFTAIEDSFSKQGNSGVIQRVISRFRQVAVPNSTVRIKDQVTISSVYGRKSVLILAGEDAKAVVLEKGANPFWEARSVKEQFDEWLKENSDIADPKAYKEILKDEEAFDAALSDNQLPSEFHPRTNYFKTPPIPVIPLHSYNIGEAYSRSIMNQLFIVQRAIDRRKRQIDETLNLMGNPQWIYDKNMISDDEIAQLTNQPGLTIGVDDPSRIRREAPQSPPVFTIEDMRHSEAAFDEIFGQHDISRGGQDRVKSATEATLISQSDRTSVRLMAKNIEKAGKLTYEWFIHLMKLFYDEKHYIEVISKEGAREIMEFDRTDIPDGLNLQIVPGSALPPDRTAIRSAAELLAQAGMIDPKSLYEIMQFPDPELMANRFVNYKMGLLTDDVPPTPEEQAEKEQAAQRRSASEQETQDMINQNEEVLKGIEG